MKQLIKRLWQNNGDSRRGDNLMAVVFAGFIAFVTILSVFWPPRSFSTAENRYLAQKPKFQFAALMDGSYGKKYETWLSDQFPLRTALVAAKVYTERMLLNEDVNGVYFGKGGYYIEKFEPEELMTGQLEKNLAFLAQAAGQFADNLGEDHVKIMLVPSASQILSDRLPLFAAPADQSLIIRDIKEKLDDPAMVLDTEGALRAHREEPVYYKTDHHWTTLGAYYGYRLYQEAVGSAPRELDSYGQKIVSNSFLGTIEAKINIPVRPDSITLFLSKKPEQYSVYYDGLPEAHSTLYNLDALSGRDQYRVFLDGNHGWTKIVRETASGDPGKNKRLLMVKDSYAHCFAPFAAADYEEVHMIDLRYYNGRLSEFAKEHEITDVLILYQIPGFSKDKNIYKIIR